MTDERDDDGQAQLKQLRYTPDEARAALPKPWSPLEAMFSQKAGRPVTKWTHYLRFYEQIFAGHRGQPVRMLEIGVHRGGSLDLWRTYFGERAIIFGVDINPECADRVDPPNQVRIGSQNDPAFLLSVVQDMGGGVDIVLDDGSHVASHQRTTFRTLWPRLAYGGVYVIEDLHSAYWPAWEGGYRAPGTAIELVKDLIDDMHGWYHDEGAQCVPREQIGQIVITDSVVAIHKVKRTRPGYVSSGDRSA
jgi:hypothetical protein